MTDAIDGGGVCTVTGGTGVTLTKKGTTGATAVLPYSCTYATNPTLVTGTNTATATWIAGTYLTPDGSKPGTAGYTFSTLTITDNVQSSANPSGCNATLGIVSVTTTTPSGSPGCGVTSLASSAWGVFTYSITDTNAALGACASYNNTAQITGGSSSTQVTVTVCNIGTGALTMGFWKNPNGQAVITKYCAPSGGTSLYTFLTQYNPFRDDTSTTKCSDQATYVYNVINKATCTSTTSTCNTMLRAQMLATALDVYFSTPTSSGGGGNQIGVYNGLGSKTPALGGVAIDLSHICSMADGSSGSTCSGIYEEARPEFGIASPALGTTVINMLYYANYPSAVNGSPVATTNTGASWYQQGKAKQVIAKDAFDNFNNQIANIAPTSVSPGF